MRAAHSVAQVRAAEEPLLRAGVPLMQRAATGLAIEVSRRLPFVYGARVVLLVGGGNNGADTLWAGAWLARRGAAVVAVCPGEVVPDALAALLKAGGRVGGPAALDGAEVVLDGLVGIGGRGPLRPAAAALVAAVPSHAMVVAVDVPSGVDADTGVISEGAVRADLTVTFGTLKPGLLLARSRVGELVLVDVGLDLPPASVTALEEIDALALLPRPGSADDKYSRGVLGVAAGSATYPGAAVLTVGAAVAAGAGMVRYAGPVAQVPARWPEAVVSPDVDSAGRVQAWVVGPGLGTEAADVLGQVLGSDVPVLVDADGLTLLALHPELLDGRTAPTLLTPHEREFARFGTTVGLENGDRLAAARGLAQRTGAHVLLKGDATVVAAPDGRARVNTTGTSRLATAGSGDVLAGVIGAFLAQGLDPLDAAALGAYLHGVAGRRAAAGASGLIEAWPAVVRDLGLGD